MNTDLESLLLASLKHLLEEVNRGFRLEHGICHNVDMIMMHKYDTNWVVGSHLYFSKYWNDWSDYSGNNSYPVPGIYKEDHEWNWTGKNKQLRISLIEFLIQSYQKGEA